jgi:hypothetical protein
VGMRQALSNMDRASDVQWVGLQNLGKPGLDASTKGGVFLANFQERIDRERDVVEKGSRPNHHEARRFRRVEGMFAAVVVTEKADVWIVPVEISF